MTVFLMSTTLWICEWLKVVLPHTVRRLGYRPRCACATRNNMQPSSLTGHVIEIFSLFRERPNIPADAQLRKFFYDRKYLGIVKRARE